jgi:hypothetical protein
MIRNLSKAGACLEIATELIDVPAEFHLRLGSNFVDCGCRVIWRSGTLIGVEFV